MPVDRGYGERSDRIGPGVPELTLVGVETSTGRPSSKSMRRDIRAVAAGIGGDTVNHLARSVSTTTVPVDYAPRIWGTGPSLVFTTARQARLPRG